MMALKKCLKDIDITNPTVIEPFIEKCLSRHAKRRDFRLYIEKEGFRNEYRQFLTGDIAAKYELAYKLSQKIAHMIKTRRIPHLKVWASQKFDYSSRKIRMIGNETVLQRLLDYVAVYGCSELWRRKLVHEQFSSIPGRGQFYGVKLLRHYVMRDNRAMEYAKSHHLRYSRKCKYFVKLDIRHCYESIDKQILMNQLVHDIKNDDMLYLWQCLLKSYDGVVNGLLIGALPSQFASQYAVVNLYRKAKENPCVTHMATYMDDMILFSTNRRKLLKAVNELIVYARNSLHLIIKPNFAIKKLENEPIDMMGLVIHDTGKVTIRAKGFIHARRMLLRYEKQKFLTYTQAKRFVSYKGDFIFADCQNIQDRYFKAFKYAQKVISQHERKKNYGTSSYIKRSAAKSNISTDG